MDILEKKKHWVTWEDKVKDLESYMNYVVSIMNSDRPDPSVQKEKDSLKAIISELKNDEDDLRKKMRDPKTAYESALEEIYQMPGNIVELKDLLKSQNNLDAEEKELIILHWSEQWNDGRRKEKSPAPHENIKAMELLMTKSAEIVKARNTELQPMVLRCMKVVQLLPCAKTALHSIVLEFPEHKYGSSSSRKKSPSKEKSSSQEEFSSEEESSSQEESSSEEESSSPKTKRAKKTC